MQKFNQNSLVQKPEFIPLSEIVKLVQKEGVDINVRKIRYWVKKGRLPIPIYIKKGKTRVSAYPREMVKEIVSLRRSEEKALEFGVSKFAQPYLVRAPRFWDIQKHGLSEVNLGATLDKKDKKIHISGMELPKMEKIDFADFAISGLIIEINSQRQKAQLGEKTGDFTELSVKFFESEKQVPKRFEPIIKGMTEIKKMKRGKIKSKLNFPVMVIEIVEKRDFKKYKKKKEKT